MKGRGMAKAGLSSDGDIAPAVEAFITASRALVGIAIRSINAAPQEITMPQHRVLVLVAARGSQSIGQLAEELSVDQSNASRLCDRLQRLGLIDRRRSDVDGRAVDVHLTRAGTSVLDAVHTYRQREVARILSGMPPRMVETAVTALAAFSRAARESTNEDWSLHAL
jgi:DNA-binding MarR family transcriptional regulator